MIESPAAGAPSLRGIVIRGAAWSAAANGVAAAANFATLLILARLLVPGDFGIQAAIVTITAFFGTLAEAGIGSAVIQREDLDQQELSSIFWGATGLAVLAWLLVTAAAPLAAMLFNAPQLVAALPVAAATIVAFGSMVVPAALLRRRLAFGAIARAQAASVLAAGAVAVITALAGAGYWALVAHALTAAVVNLLAVSWFAGWRPTTSFTTAHLARVRSYAAPMSGFVTVNYWARNLDDVLIGRFLGVAPLGIYTLAQRFVDTPMQLLTGSIVPLLHPAFAAMGRDAARQRAAYLELVRLTALASFPAAAILWVAAEPLVVLLAGEQWRESAGVLRALAVLAAVQPVNALCGPVYMARDAAGTMLKTAIVGAAGVAVGMIAGLGYGVTGVAWGYTAGYVLVSAPVATLVALRLLDARARDLGRALAMPMLAGGAALAAGVLLTRLVGGQ